ncbi:MAG: alkaline phosphatase family protein [Clostridia bacterium]|nr:alkaline phosphatase family protein [Clostridia bacterium]
MKYPDYDRSSLSITASVGAFLGGESNYPTLPEIDLALCRDGVKKIVLVLCDGMGELLMRRHLPADCFLRKNDKAAISSVFPSTTAAATTSIWTGLSPLEHGWIGWSMYFKECAAAIDVFTGNVSGKGVRYPDGSPAPKLMPLPGVMAGAKHPGMHMVSAFDNFPGKGFTQHAVRTFHDQLVLANALIRQEDNALVCVYNGEPDHTMHNKGVNAPETVEKFVAANRELEWLSGVLPEDTLLIVTADHGLVDGINPVDLKAIPSVDECLWMPPSVEARAAALFVKPFRRAQFEREFRAVCGDEFLLIPREDALSMNLLGRGIVHPKAEDAMGDYLACATGASFIVYGAIPDMIGMHAGLTDEEMTVPVILARGRGGKA